MAQSEKQSHKPNRRSTLKASFLLEFQGCQNATMRFPNPLLHKPPEISREGEIRRQSRGLAREIATHAESRRMVFGEKMMTVSKESQSTPRVHAWEGPWHEVRLSEGPLRVSRAWGSRRPGPSLSPPLRQWELAKESLQPECCSVFWRKTVGQSCAVSAAESRHPGPRSLPISWKQRPWGAGQATVLGTPPGRCGLIVGLSYPSAPADSSAAPLPARAGPAPPGIHMGP